VLLTVLPDASGESTSHWIAKSGKHALTGLAMKVGWLGAGLLSIPHGPMYLPSESSAV
jgi:hypothetical protein